MTALIDAHGDRLLYRLVRLVGIPLLKLFFHIEVRGRLDALRTGPCVVAANHLGWIDAPLLLLAFPRNPRMNFVADATYMTSSRWHWTLGRLAGGILPVVEHAHATRFALGTALACLELGGRVGFFPEGRYGDDELSPLTFHHGFAVVALEGRVPVVPVRLSGTKELWLRKHLRVEIGEPIAVAGQSSERLAQEVRARIMTMTPASAGSGPRVFRRLLTRHFL